MAEKDCQHFHQNEVTDDYDVDIFDSLVMAEERFTNEGYTEGFTDGCKQGYAEGLKKGVAMGTAVASEVGFYCGFVSGLKMILGGNAKPSRKLKTLQSFEELVTSFPVHDATHNELIEELEKIRAKFKQQQTNRGR